MADQRTGLPEAPPGHWVSGHSDGASIALIHAGGGHPVTGIVALAPHVMVETCTLDDIRTAREEYWRGQLRDRLARHHDDVDAAFAVALSAGCSAEEFHGDGRNGATRPAEWCIA